MCTAGWVVRTSFFPPVSIPTENCSTSYNSKGGHEAQQHTKKKQKQLHGLFTKIACEMAENNKEKSAQLLSAVSRKVIF